MTSHTAQPTDNQLPGNQPPGNQPPGNEAARFLAQRLAFAPLMFQACRALRDVGILERLSAARARGLTVSQAVEQCNVSRYAASLLLEAGLASGLCSFEDCEPEPRFFMAAAGVYWLRDPLTRANAEFNHHVCFKGAFHLREALLAGKPLGLESIDATGARTVYEALRTLPPEVRTAWFDFDHFYSDGVFEACVSQVLQGRGRHVVDIGGNTGRFARLCLERGAGHVTLVDLPGQLADAQEQLKAFSAKTTFQPTNLLDATAALPQGADAYWLSQFLDCFAEDEIRSILQRVASAMRSDSRAFILEPFWNRQRHEAARFCVIGTSLYFACIANGNSRMYHSEVMRRLVGEAGLKVTHEDHTVGLSHSLFTCQRA